MSQFSNAILGLSPVAYYRLNEASGTSAADSSGNALNATYGSAITLNQTSLLPLDAAAASVKFSGAVGLTDTIAGPRSALLETAHFSALFTVKLVTQGQTDNLISCGRAVGGAAWGWIINYSIQSGAIVLYTNNSSTAVVTGSVNVADGKTHFVAVVCDGTNASIYVDGKLDAQAAYNTSITGYNGTSGVIMGDTSGAGSGNTYNGNLQDVAVYSTGLTATQIQGIYQQGFGTYITAGGSVVSGGVSPYPSNLLSLGPVLYWRLGENAQTTYDLTANHLNGTIGSGITKGTIGLLPNDPDKAARWPGTTGNASSEITSPRSTLLETSNVSIVFLMQVGAQAQNDNLVSCGRAIGGASWGWLLNINGGAIAVYANGAAVVTGTKNVTDNVRHHVAVTYDGATMKIYIDGALDASAAFASGITGYNGTTGVILGDTSGGASTYNGTVDEFSTFNKALTATQVSTLWTQSSAAYSQIGAGANITGTVTTTTTHLGAGANIGSRITIGAGANVKVTTTTSSGAGASVTRATSTTIGAGADVQATTNKTIGAGAQLALTTAIGAGARISVGTTIGAGASVKATTAQSIGAGADVRANATKPISAGASVSAVTTRSTGAGASLGYLGTRAAGAGAAIALAAPIAAAAIIQRTTSAVAAAASRLQATASGALSGGAHVAKTPTLSIGAGARIALLGSITIGSGAIVSVRNVLTAGAGALLSFTSRQSLNAGATVSVRSSLAVGAGARVVGVAQIGAAALLTAVSRASSGAGALIRGTSSVAASAGADITATGAFTIRGGAAIGQRASASLGGGAAIVINTQLQLAAGSRIAVTTYVRINANASLLGVVGSSVGAGASIVRIGSMTCQSGGTIKANGAQALTSGASIKANTAQTITAGAKVATFGAFTIAAGSRIGTEGYLSVAAAASVSAIARTTSQARSYVVQIAQIFASAGSLIGVDGSIAVRAGARLSIYPQISAGAGAYIKRTPNPNLLWNRRTYAAAVFREDEIDLIYTANDRKGL